MNTIRAIVADSQHDSGLAIRVVEMPIRTLSEALVRVHAVSLNPGELRLLPSQKAGARIGWDLAGVIEQAATDGSGPQVGTRVIGLVHAGAWAERVAVPTAVLAS